MSKISWPGEYGNQLLPTFKMDKPLFFTEMRYRSKLCSRKDSPLVINPLWSVSSFRNSSLISCSSFLENASIDLVVRKQNCQKNWHQKKWHQRYLLDLGLLNNQNRKSPKTFNYDSTSPSPLMATHNLLNSEKSIFSFPSLSA